MQFGPSIRNNFSGISSIIDASNVGSYPGSGSTFYDLISTTNSTLVGSPTFYSPSPLANGGDHFYLNGTTQSINMGSTPSNGYSVTISVWIYFDYYRNFGIFGKGTFNQPFSGFYFDVSTNTGNQYNNRPYLFYPISTTGLDGFFCNTVIPIGRWCNYTFYKSNAVYAIYLNGVADGARAMAYNDNMTGNLTMGLTKTNAFGQCRISQVVTWNVALSASQILAYYNATKFRYGL